MIRHVFVFGVVVPTLVTIALFLGFLLCWYKFNMRERLFSRKNRKSIFKKPEIELQNRKRMNLHRKAPGKARRGFSPSTSSEDISSDTDLFELDEDPKSFREHRIRNNQELNAVVIFNKSTRETSTVVAPVSIPRKPNVPDVQNLDGTKVTLEDTSRRTCRLKSVTFETDADETKKSVNLKGKSKDVTKPDRAASRHKAVSPTGGTSDKPAKFLRTGYVNSISPQSDCVKPKRVVWNQEYRPRTDPRRSKGTTSPSGAREPQYPAKSGTAELTGILVNLDLNADPGARKKPGNNADCRTTWDGGTALKAGVSKPTLPLQTRESGGIQSTMDSRTRGPKLGTGSPDSSMFHPGVSSQQHAIVSEPRSGHMDVDLESDPDYPRLSPTAAQPRSILRWTQSS